MGIFRCCCSTTVIAVGCPCNGGSNGTTPSTLYMHVTNETLNLHNFHPDTLNYQANPAYTAGLGIAASNWYGAGSWVDLVGGDTFHYFFRCEGGSYALRRIYPPPNKVNGNQAYLAPVLYKWVVGFPGNQCQTATTQFTLNNGNISQGGDARTVVKVDAVGPP